MVLGLGKKLLLAMSALFTWSICTVADSWVILVLNLHIEKSKIEGVTDFVAGLLCLV